MKTYVVRMSVTEQYTYHVEANSPEDAVDRIQEGLGSNDPPKEIDYNETEYQLVDVEEVEG